nr:SURF1 family protein [Comamonas sp. NLF-1-9]
MIAVLALAIAVATGWLGSWQLSRAHEKLAAHQAMLEREQLAPWSGPQLLAALAQDPALAQTQAYHPVRLRGRWLADATVYLENRQMHGKPGFYVYTPLQLAESGQVLAVQRGWAPRDFNDRARLPQLPEPEGEVVLQGRIAGEPGRLFEFAESADARGAGEIRQNLTIAAYAADFSLDLLPLSVAQTGAANDGLLRDWPAPDSGVDMHYGYAFQWFGLCALVIVLYVWFQLIRRLGGRRR